MSRDVTKRGCAWARAALWLMLAGLSGVPAASAADDGAVARQGSEAEEIARAEALVDVDGGDAGARDQARALLDAVLAANPASAAAHREYARIHMVDYFTSGERHDPQGLEKAERALDRAVELDPEFGEARVLRGHLYTMLERYAEAHAELDAAEALGGTSAWLHINRGNLLRQQDRPEDALAACRRVQVEAESVRIARAVDRCTLGALNALQHADDAEAVYLAALARDPDHADNHGNYAWFLLCRRGRPQAAIEHALDALRLEDDGDVRITLATALYADWAQAFRSGDAEAEAEAFARASTAASSNPIALMDYSCGGQETLELMRALRDSGRFAGIAPMVAVLAAAEAEDRRVPGIYAFTVAATGEDARGAVFLNSEDDYRDQRNLTVRLGKDVADAWRALHREDPQALKGRRITVAGYVRRVRIDFTDGGVPTGKFYYQTHLDVHEPWQIMVGDVPGTTVPEGRPQRTRL